MRHTSKTKTTTLRSTRRKPVLTAAVATRRGFPAWIDAGETGVVFAAAKAAMPRVRAGLVLRVVAKKKDGRTGRDGSRAR